VFTTVLDEEDRDHPPSPTRQAHVGSSRQGWLNRRVTSGSTDRSHRAESDTGTTSGRGTQ
jgi:hypothetical protein